MSAYVINSYAFVTPEKFWVPTQPALPVTLTGFRATTSGGTPITVTWGDGTTQVLTSNIAVNKTFNVSTSGINLDSQPTMTAIICGASSPQFGGIVDVSDFLNLQELRCVNNGVTNVIGYAGNSNLRIVDISNNALSGTIPSLDANVSLRLFDFRNNQYTGNIPSFTNLSALQNFNCTSNSLTGSIPSFSNNGELRFFSCIANRLTGSIPSLSNNPLLIDFRCTNQLGTIKLTGTIPDLSNNTQLTLFDCDRNQLSGSIPDLSSNTALGTFRCYTNQITGFAGGSVSNTLGLFLAHNNLLTSSAVNAILAAFVAAGRTSASGTCFLRLDGTGNAAPTGQGLTDKSTLLSRGWDVRTN